LVVEPGHASGQAADEKASNTGMAEADCFATPEATLASAEKAQRKNEMGGA